MIRYLSGVSSKALQKIAHERGIGLLVQPGNGYGAQVMDYPFWAADNGCFSQGEAFDLEAYLSWLRELAPFAGTCLFATAPDVVGNMTASWERSAPVLERIRALGFRAALVAQNGLAVRPDGALRIYRDERLPDSFTGVTIPWESFDVLFIGGDDRFKLSFRQHFLIDACKAHGKPVHVGRVNSYKRLQQAEWFGADTADGTFLAYAGREGQDVAVERMEWWLDNLWSMPVPRLGDPGQGKLNV